jgi:DNA invertase Pin-like site-specific DNA recombinase
MMDPQGHKVTPDHLARDAYLYIRQSTYRQIQENQESTRRQYALRDRALALGWPAQRVVVIDSDLGQSGASAEGRLGFQRLVADVSLGRVGIVLGLEVSRLARSSTDWSRLLEICALSQTLLLDEDGLYNPADFNDRLLLGLKGTMSEAELHFLKARMRGGLLNKASRGELRTVLPVGFIYTPDGRVELDPDQQVQQAIRHLFATFRRVGSARGTVKACRAEGLLFPHRAPGGATNAELHWGPLALDQVLGALHNPRYAGAFAFGRRRCRRTPLGTHHSTLPQEQWFALFPDAHRGYITWADYQENQRRLRANDTDSEDLQVGPVREGMALLQGIVICGRCGARMAVTYQTTRTGRRANYVCSRELRRGGGLCQFVVGAGIDQAVGELVLEAFAPLALDVVLAVQEELRARIEEVDRMRRQHVQRVRYEAELAQRRYMSVDPHNRLVAAQLEQDWNEALGALRDAEAEYQRERDSDPKVLDEQQRQRLLTLSVDFPRLWNDPHTAVRDRKRLLRLVVEDITVLKQETNVVCHVRFRGGANRTLTLPRPLRPQIRYRTPREVIDAIDHLLDEHTEREAAAILNRQGLRSGYDTGFSAPKVHRIAQVYGLRTRRERLRARGLVSVRELADELHVGRETIRRWYREGRLTGYPLDSGGRYLLERPGPELVTRRLAKHEHRQPR